MTPAIDFLGDPGIFDYGLAPVANYVDERVDLEDETMELRIASNTDSSFQWLLGAYRKEASYQADYDMQRGFEFVTDVGIAMTRDTNKYEETAFFGEASYDISDAFSFTIGVRALDYDFEQRKADWGFVYDPGAGGLPESEANILEVAASDNETHYRATLSWQAFESGQLYLTSSDATRPGGGNRSIPRSTDPADGNAFFCDQELNALGITGNPTSYSGDSVENLEVGLKMDPSDAVRLNAAVYRIEWTDIQQRISTSGNCGFNFTGNIGEAESVGAEVEIEAAINDNLTLLAGVGYTDATFSQTVTQAGVSKGDELPDVPQVTGTVAVDWSSSWRSGELFFLGSMSYVDTTLEIPGSSSTDVSDLLIDAGNERPSFTLVNTRIGYVSDKGWQVSLFVDNLTDDEAYFSYNDAIVVNVPGFDRIARNRPRTFGIAGQFNF
jgi:outer membrane receptor protein involved in Fe transport